MKFALAVLVLGSVAAGQTTTRVSVDSGGNESNGNSRVPSVSGNGRYIAFHAEATNLDAAGLYGVFVRDLQSGTTERASISSGGMPGDGNYPAISADGRFVAFDSTGALVAGDTNGVTDIFVRDRTIGTTERVSVDSAGAEANGGSGRPFISSDGRFVAFSSDAFNLVAGDTNGVGDVFVHDRRTGATERVSVGSNGAEGTAWSYGGSISGDGRFTVFESLAANLVPGDSNGVVDIFVRDRQLGITQRVSISTAGGQADLGCQAESISGSGRFVAFDSLSALLAPGDTNGARDVFLRDLVGGTTERVSVADSGIEGNLESETSALSDDGRFVVFHSDATNLVHGDSNGWGDIFVRDRLVSKTRRMSTATSGVEGTVFADYWPSVSANGQTVGFGSAAPNIVLQDTNHCIDMFVRDRGVSDCNGNGVDDALDLQSGVSADCNGNDIPDECDLSQGTSVDCDGNGLLDPCEIATHAGLDQDHDGVIDTCAQPCVAGWHRGVGMNDGADGAVVCMAVVDLGAGAALYTGGDFLHIGGAAANRVARWDGISWQALGSGLGGGTVQSLCAYDGGTGTRLYALGSFTTAGGSPSQGVAYWDGASWTSVPSVSALNPRCSVVFNDGTGSKLYFDRGNTMMCWNGSTLTPLPVAGVVAPAVGACIAHVDGGTPYLYVGGYDGNDHSYIARWDGAGWSSTVGGFGAMVSCFGESTVGGNSVLYCGLSPAWFQTSFGNLAAVTGTQASSLLWSSDGVIDGLCSFDDGTGQSVYACGEFGASVSWIPAHVARWDGSTFQPLGYGAGGRVRAMAVFDDGSGPALFVGGDFSAIDNVPAFRVASWGLPASCTGRGTSICDPGTGGVMTCPCTNPPGLLGRGCDNSSGTGGAIVSTTGFAHLSQDNLTLLTTGEKPGALSIVLQGTSMNASGATFGQGVRCVAGSLKRLYIKSAIGGTITAPGAGDPSVSTRSAALGDVIAQGVHRFYGVYYRDPVVLGGCPASSTFNMTQQLDVLWHP